MVWGIVVLVPILGCIGIWWLHRLVALMLLVVCRDAVVPRLGLNTSEETEKQAVTQWLVTVPFLAFMVWSSIVDTVLSSPDHYLPWFVSLAIAAASAGLLLYHYYKLYFQRPVNYPTWPRFVAASVELKFDAKLAYIESLFHFKLRQKR